MRVGRLRTFLSADEAHDASSYAQRLNTTRRARGTKMPIVVHWNESTQDHRAASRLTAPIPGSDKQFALAAGVHAGPLVALAEA